MAPWPRRPRAWGDPLSIAVFAPNLIGDTVMATPAFRAIRARFPDARMQLVGRAGVLEVLAGAPWFDARIVLDARSSHRAQRGWSVARRLRAERADVAVLFPNSVRSALVAWSARIARRVGFDRGDRGLLLTDRLDPPRDGRGRFVPTPAVGSYLAIARRLGCASADSRTELFTTPDDEGAADAAWARLGLPVNGRVVCLNNGGAYGPSKNWPNSYFGALARRLVTQHHVHVLILCGPAERESARVIVAEAALPGVVSLADEPIGIGLSKACVRRSALLITTDSGPRHFAAAFGVPEVTLFGPTHIEWTRTENPAATYLQEVVPCGPCQRPVCPETHHRCMRELSPERVFHAATEILRGRKTRVA